MISFFESMGIVSLIFRINRDVGKLALLLGLFGTLFSFTTAGTGSLSGYGLYCPGDGLDLFGSWRLFNILRFLPATIV